MKLTLFTFTQYVTSVRYTYRGKKMCLLDMTESLCLTTIHIRNKRKATLIPKGAPLRLALTSFLLLVVVGCLVHLQCMV